MVLFVGPALRRCVRLLVACGSLWLPAAAAADPPLTLRGMTFVSSKGSIHRVIVESKTAVLYPDNNRVELMDGVRALLEGTEGSEGLELTCERGEYDLNTNDFQAEGDVVGRLADGRTFSGPWIRYDAAEALAHSDAPTEITDGGQVLRGGGGVRYWVRDERLQLLGGATVEETR